MEAGDCSGRKGAGKGGPAIIEAKEDWVWETMLRKERMVRLAAKLFPPDVSTHVGASQRR
jgi:hypothetical protein